MATFRGHTFKTLPTLLNRMLQRGNRVQQIPKTPGLKQKLSILMQNFFKIHTLETYLEFGKRIHEHLEGKPKKKMDPEIHEARI